MIELAKTFDPVRLAFLRAVLEDAGVEVHVFDTGAGSIWPGAVPSRVMIAAENRWRAQCALAAAGDVEGQD